jgi:hypothetical protein
MTPRCRGAICRLSYDREDCPRVFRTCWMGLIASLRAPGISQGCRSFASRCRCTDANHLTGLCSPPGTSIKTKTHMYYMQSVCSAWARSPHSSRDWDALFSLLQSCSCSCIPLSIPAVCIGPRMKTSRMCTCGLRMRLCIGSLKRTIAPISLSD